MLATRRMGSHPGQNGLPFGYDTQVVHAIGLPDFMTAGPPAGPPPAPPPHGQPLLNAHENHNFMSFLSDFETGDVAESMKSTTSLAATGEIPPFFLGSETSLGHRNGPSIDPHHLQTNGMMYGNGFMESDMSMMPNAMQYDHTIHHATSGLMGNSYTNTLPHQYPTPSATVQSAYPSHWSVSFHPQRVVPPASRNLMRFGSDSHFSETGYVAPPNQQEPDVIHNLEGFEWDPQSGTNTQPNTQPSSPSWSRKRKLADFTANETTSYQTAPTNGHHAISNSVNERAEVQDIKPIKRRRKSVVKQGSTSIEPHESNKPSSKRQPPNRGRRKSPSTTPPPSSSSSSKKHFRARPSTSQTNPTNTPKQKPSSSRPSTSASAARTPLTHDQKKANHTNSEQRRRDATGRAYAELYDLVPELEGMGKLSTTKKLERVVQKCRDTKAGNAQLREMLGMSGAR